MARTHRSVTLLALGVLAESCSTGAEPQGATLALRDPYALIDDITPAVLRVIVLPASGFSCDSASGVVSPSPSEVRDATIPEAVVNVSVDIVMSGATSTVDLAAGEYVVLVRGRGNDVPSMRMDVVIATSCATTTVASGETKEVALELKPVVLMGSCGDGILSPDEQCEDSNMAAGDGCDARCQTEPFTFNVPPDGDQITPSVAWTAGARVVGAYDSTAPTDGVHLMYRDDRGAVIASPTALSVDVDVEPRPGIQTESSVSVGGDRVFVAFTDFVSAMEGSNVRVKIFTLSGRTPPADMTTSVLVHTGVDMNQGNPAIASRADGATMVVFEDQSAPTGLRGRVFAPGSSMPAGADAFTVGAGATGGVAPQIAATSSGFVVVFNAAGDVHYQRFDADGTPTDVTAHSLLSGGELTGTQDQPTVATAGCSGAAACGIVAWRDDGPMGDGDGTAIRAILITGDGMPMGSAFLVDTTAAGAQSEPTAAAGATRYVVAWQSATSVRARVFALDGSAALNRAKEPAPSSNDFTVVAAGAHPAAAIGGADGALLVVYEAAGDIGGRLFALP